jgi:DNA (cytosine-5)-methyltransferase 1
MKNPKEILLTPRSHISPQQDGCSSDTRLCVWCEADQQFLRSRRQPRVFHQESSVRVADLFAGCGGMAIGLREAARELRSGFEVSLAIDNDEAAIEIYKRNLLGANAHVADVRDLFDGDLGGTLTRSERQIRAEAGKVDLLIGGPPCQGHSDLNNHTRRSDPKNALLLTMARAAEVLRPRIVLVENVPPVQWDRAGVLEMSLKALTVAGYKTSGAVVNLARVGLPQRRKRYLLVASKNASVTPSIVLSELEKPFAGHPERTVHWAIHDLMGTARAGTYDSVGRITPENRRRIAFLFEHGVFDLPNELRPRCHRDGNHSYISVYGRLKWSRSAQTITTGFGSMGQGRYVHPQRRRTITPHEAARLQTFPDWFDFGDKTSRSVLAKVIGNAVPPFLMRELGRIIIPKMVSTLTEGAA